MNHRQWKKKFKKVHGRAPYPWEDKRVSETARYNLEEMFGAIGTIPKILAKAAADAAETLSKGFAKIADSLRRY